MKGSKIVFMRKMGNATENMTETITRAAVIAALYVALTLAFAPVSFGPIQFRVSEALCVLPYFTFSAVPGLGIGCVLANLLAGAPLPDVIFGSLATFLAAILSRRIGRVSKWLVCIPPIALNALIIPFVLRFAYGVRDFLPYLALTVGLGEVMAVGILGNVFLLALEGRRIIFPGWKTEN